MKDWELRLAWIAADSMTDKTGKRSVFCDFYLLALLSGQRRDEVAGITWQELDRNRAIWDLPAERAKNGVPLLIHLSATMIEILDRRAGREDWPKRGFVFTTNGRSKISGYSKAKRRIDQQMIAIAQREAVERGDDPAEVAIEDWDFHDLRRTLATNCQRLGVRFEVTEAMINHVSGAKSGVAGIYQRYDWWLEKQAGWNAYDAFVRQIVEGEGGNVLPFPERVTV